MTTPVITIDYTNWRGERSQCHIRPTGRMVFESNEYHKEAQWLMEAIDLDKNAMPIRLFAMVSIHSWGQE